MTTATAFSEDWVNHPVGKTLRVMIAVGGLITATLVVLLAALGAKAVWFLVLLGLTLGATAVRAAIQPSIVRLMIVTAAMIAIPITGLIV